MIKLVDQLSPMGNFAVAAATDIVCSDNERLQDKIDNGTLGGGDSSIVLSQAEYDALSDEEKMSDQEYLCYDTGRIYKLDVVFGDKKPVTLTFEEYKALEEAGSVEADVDYIIVGNESGALLSDLDIEHGATGTTAYEVIETLKSDVENLIDDTNLTSTTSTVSASKVKNAITYSFDTQSGNVKYVKFKPSITTISVIDIYGGKIEILGASKAAANPSYKTVKVVRLSYGDWGSYDATQVPSVVHTKIGELYYYPTDEYYYLKLYNYAAFTMTGLTTAPEIITSLPAEESAMTLIPESVFASKGDLTTKLDKGYITGIADANDAIGENGINIFVMSAADANLPLPRTGVIRSFTTIENKYIRVNQEYSTIDNSPQNGGTYKRYGASDDGGATFTWSNWNFVGSIDDSTTALLKTWSSSKIASEIGAKITKTQYRGSRSIDISTGGKLTLIYSSEYASQAGCYMLLSNFNTEPLLIELGRNDIGQFSVTATHKSQNVDTITVTAAGDEYSWCVLQF